MHSRQADLAQDQHFYITKHYIHIETKIQKRR
jgi:hypothetical protein